MDLNFSDRIILGLVTENEELATAIRENGDYIKQETLAVKLDWVNSGPIGRGFKSFVRWLFWAAQYSISLPCDTCRSR